MSKQYKVSVAEVHYQDVLVTADSEKQAKERVAAGKGEFVDNSLEFSHALDESEWKVEEN